MVLKMLSQPVKNLTSLGLFLFMLNNPVLAQVTYTLKFATLIPPDTAWVNRIQQWNDELKQQSDGRLQLKIYPGGVMGDEPDVLRKIRSQQLHGAFFTGYGISRIYPPARVLEMPFLFRNTDESDYVRRQIMPEIEAGFAKAGYQLVGWPEVGFLHFFSKLPITSLEELKSRRIWLWQGDPMGEAFAQAAGVSPVPLSIMDVYTQLSAQHGSIDTVYNSPFGALAMQWHSKLSYASNVPMTNAIGSLVVSQRFYDKLPEDLQQLLKSTGKKVAEEINIDSRRDNAKSIELLKQSGIEFSWDWNESERKQMIEIRDRAAEILNASGYIPEAHFTRVKNSLSEYRRNQPSQ